MLIVALVLAVIGLAALVTAVVTSNELIAWVCIAASVIGVVLLIVDAVRERSRGGAEEAPAQADESEAEAEYVEDYPEESPVAAESEDDSDAETAGVTKEGDDEDRNGR
jgi:flagellar biosynthesis/type III secretory pathway M-ring protein FliF/YscJ